MTSLAFLTAVYNEENEIEDLLNSVRPYVDTIVVSDDGSTDRTVQKALSTGLVDVLVMGEHLASCEETRIRGFRRVDEDWVLFMDADERISPEGLAKIRDFIDSEESIPYTHVYFSQKEYIDGELMHDFAKLKLGRTEYMHFPVGIHDDPSCWGEPTNIGVEVIHRKTWGKQIMRETEYLDAYQRKIKEGKMTQQRAEQVSTWHYIVKTKS